MTRAPQNMDPTLAAMRMDYDSDGLVEEDLAPDPITQFQRWFDAARAAGVEEANAMILATVDDDGQPSARVVLLKGLDERGLAFFTNMQSRKAHALERNPKAALTFWWPALHRQVRFEGGIQPVAAPEADAYFSSRPRGSRIGAWASPQSEVIKDRAVLEAAQQRFAALYPDEAIPRPPHWGGYRLAPAMVEFWQGQTSRLHDRLRYRQSAAGWWIERLAP